MIETDFKNDDITENDVYIVLSNIIEEKEKRNRLIKIIIYLLILMLIILFLVMFKLIMLMISNKNIRNLRQ